MPGSSLRHLLHSASSVCGVWIVSGGKLIKIKGHEKQADTFKLLRPLLGERDQTAYVHMLPQVIINTMKYDNDTREFGSNIKILSRAGHIASIYMQG